jgi:hypothetical protein
VDAPHVGIFSCVHKFRYGTHACFQRGNNGFVTHRGVLQVLTGTDLPHRNYCTMWSKHVERPTEVLSFRELSFALTVPMFETQILFSFGLLQNNTKHFLLSILSF